MNNHRGGTQHMNLIHELEKHLRSVSINKQILFGAKYCDPVHRYQMHWNVKSNFQQERIKLLLFQGRADPFFFRKVGFRAFDADQPKRGSSFGRIGTKRCWQDDAETTWSQLNQSRNEELTFSAANIKNICSILLEISQRYMVAVSSCHESESKCQKFCKS